MMIGLGLRFGSVFGGSAALIMAIFKARVAADGGTFEADNCFIANINGLINIDLYPVGDAVMIALRDRAVADSGTFEAYNCGIIAIQNLANIDI